MGVSELQAYMYVASTGVISVVFYMYIYHLYTKRRDSDGHDYEEYANLALKDDIADKLINAKPRDKEK